jgi:uncharacterized RDD family membrane protein YckC
VSLPSHATTYPVAQLERRFTAFAVDRALSWSLLAAAGVATWAFVGDDLAVVAGVVAGTAVLLWLVLSAVLGTTGSSPGKSLTGLRVVHHGTGTQIGVGRALLRSLVLAVSGLPTFGIGLATLAWTAVEDRGRQRRGWHDQVGHSVVVDVRPAPEQVEVAVEEAPRHVVNLTAMRLIPAPPVEVPRTPERTRTPEQSVRRQPLSADLAPAPQPVPVRPAPQQAQPQHAQVQQAQHQRAPQPAPQPQPPPYPTGGDALGGPPPQVAPVPRWRVHFDNGESFVVAGMALVGRRPEPRTGEVVAHLVPLASQDMSVSKTHAQFGPAPDGAIVVMDRGSTNGTTVVRRGVSRQLTPGRPTTLVEGDKVVFGDREMVLSREA